MAALEEEAWRRLATGAQSIPASVAAPFLASSGLERPTLSAIWALADAQDIGSLDRAGFARAWRCVSMAQFGADVTAAALHAMRGAKLPPPEFAALSSVPSALPPAPLPIPSALDTASFSLFDAPELAQRAAAAAHRERLSTPLSALVLGGGSSSAPAPPVRITTHPHAPVTSSVASPLDDAFAVLLEGNAVPPMQGGSTSSAHAAAPGDEDFGGFVDASDDGDFGSFASAAPPAAHLPLFTSAASGGCAAAVPIDDGFGSFDASVSPSAAPPPSSIDAFAGDDGFGSFAAPPTVPAPPVITPPTRTPPVFPAAPHVPTRTPPPPLLPPAASTASSPILLRQQPRKEDGSRGGARRDRAAHASPALAFSIRTTSSGDTPNEEGPARVTHESLDVHMPPVSTRRGVNPPMPQPLSMDAFLGDNTPPPIVATASTTHEAAVSATSSPGPTGRRGGRAHISVSAPSSHVPVPSAMRDFIVDSDAASSMTLPPLDSAFDPFSAVPRSHGGGGHGSEADEVEAVLALSAFSGAVDALAEKALRPVQAVLGLSGASPAAAASAQRRPTVDILRSCLKHLHMCDELFTRALLVVDALPRVASVAQLRKSEVSRVNALSEEVDLARAVAHSYLEEAEVRVSAPVEVPVSVPPLVPSSTGGGGGASIAFAPFARLPKAGVAASLAPSVRPILSFSSGTGGATATAPPKLLLPRPGSSALLPPPSTTANPPLAAAAATLPPQVVEYDGSAEYCAPPIASLSSQDDFAPFSSAQEGVIPSATAAVAALDPFAELILLDAEPEEPLPTPPPVANAPPPAVDAEEDDEFDAFEAPMTAASEPPLMTSNVLVEPLSTAIQRSPPEPPLLATAPSTLMTSEPPPLTAVTDEEDEFDAFEAAVAAPAAVSPVMTTTPPPAHIEDMFLSAVAAIATDSAEEDDMGFGTFDATTPPLTIVAEPLPAPTPSPTTTASEVPHLDDEDFGAFDAPIIAPAATSVLAHIDDEDDSDFCAFEAATVLPIADPIVAAASLVASVPSASLVVEEDWGTIAHDDFGDFDAPVKSLPQDQPNIEEEEEEEDEEDAFGDLSAPPPPPPPAARTPLLSSALTSDAVITWVAAVPSPAAPLLAYALHHTAPPSSLLLAALEAALSHVTHGASTVTRALLAGTGTEKADDQSGSMPRPLSPAAASALQSSPKLQRCLASLACGTALCAHVESEFTATAPPSLITSLSTARHALSRLDSTLDALKLRRVAGS